MILCLKSLGNLYIQFLERIIYFRLIDKMSKGVDIFCQGFHQSSQMPYNVTFPIESNFPISSRHVSYFMFSILKAFVIIVTFLLFKVTYMQFKHVGKVLKITFIEIFLRQKTLNKKLPDTQLCLTRLTVRGQAFS